MAVVEHDAPKEPQQVCLQGSGNACRCRHPQPTFVPAEKNKACITLSSELENFSIINFKIYRNMLRNMSHYIPGTVAATSLKGQPVYRLTCAARAAQLPPRGTSAKRASRSSSHVGGTTQGPTAVPTSGNPSK